MSIEVELYTSEHVLQGQVETAGDRLSDILNNNTESGLMLREVKVTRLLEIGKGSPAQIPLAMVHKESLLFAVPVAQRDLTHKSIYRRAARQAYEIVVFVPNFELSGMIHMTERLDIRRVLTTRSEDYIPITHAQATFVLYPRVVVKAETIILNKSQVTLLGQTAGLAALSPR
ncbi:MAG: hypothetical protein JXA37_12860 [Chloroflexia bacterium]|nr:hypothetical protein [Chloroflexia bacterium]